MTMVSMFKELGRIEKAMEEHCNQLTVDELETLDSSHDEAWDVILGYEPPNAELRELMLLMLLDKMEDRAREGESCVRVREKILSLFETRELGFASVGSSIKDLQRMHLS
ncbi:MAG: hypothetical protein AAFN43_12645 [Pseudomonadota bacterium]